MSDYITEARDLQNYTKFIPIKILVWGPGDPGIDAPPEREQAYRKRLQIRDELKRFFVIGEVYFSEDLPMVNLVLGIKGQLRKETIQAKLSDLIIMLDISRGADLELDFFVPNYPWFRDKVHVFLPERYVTPAGLVKEVFDFLRPSQVEGFSQQEFDCCSIATVKAIEIARNYALDKYLKMAL